MRVNWAFHHAMWLFYRKHQAARYGPAISVVVGLGILVRFVLSTILNSFRRLRLALASFARKRSMGARLDRGLSGG